MPPRTRVERPGDPDYCKERLIEEEETEETTETPVQPEQPVETPAPQPVGPRITIPNPNREPALV